MPSDDFWNPTAQFRGVRSAEVLNQSLGALSDIDNVLSENDRQNQRQRRPMFYVAPEDRMSDAEIDRILMHTIGSDRGDVRYRDSFYGETRPEPTSTYRRTGDTVFAAAARRHPLGSPEYWSLIDRQNEYTKAQGLSSSVPNDFLQYKDAGYRGDDVEFHEGPDTPRARTRVPLGPDNHPMWGQSEGMLKPRAANRGRTTFPEGQVFGGGGEGSTRLGRAQMSHPRGGRYVPDLIAEGQTFVGGARQGGTNYGGTYGFFNYRQRRRLNLNMGQFYSGIDRRTGDSLAGTVSNILSQESWRSQASWARSGWRGKFTRVGYSYATPVVFHVPRDISADFGLEEGQRTEEVLGHPSVVLPTTANSPLGAGHWIMPETRHSRTTSRHQAAFLTGIHNYFNRHA